VAKAAWVGGWVDGWVGRGYVGVRGEKDLPK